MAELKVLIVEDDPTSRFLLERFLRSYGAIDTAAAGREGVDKVSRALEDKHPYGLICLDLVLPDLYGLEALKLIRKEEYRHLITEADQALVLITSGLDLPEGLADERIVHLEKPIERTRLTEILREYDLIG